MSLLIDGKPYEVPGVVTKCPLDDPKLQLTREDCGPRPRRGDGTVRRIRQIVLHTTQGLWPQAVLPGSGSGGGAWANIHHAQVDKKHAAAHLWIDTDGVVLCSADLYREQTWHAGSKHEDGNPLSIGIEMVQRSDGALRRATLDSVVPLLDALTRHPLFRIQRQFVDAYRGEINRFDINNGWDCVGIFGHRDISAGRGRGDPGDAVFALLHDAGYESFNYLACDDLERWKSRQMVLGLRGKSIDGVPLDETCDLLAATGKKHGLWVERPGD